MGSTRNVAAAVLVSTGTIAGGIALSRTVDLGAYHTPPAAVPDAMVAQRAAELAEQQERLDEALAAGTPGLPTIVRGRPAARPGTTAPGARVPFISAAPAAPVSPPAASGTPASAGPEASPSGMPAPRGAPDRRRPATTTPPLAPGHTPAAPQPAVPADTTAVTPEAPRRTPAPPAQEETDAPARTTTGPRPTTSTAATPPAPQPPRRPSRTTTTTASTPPPVPVPATTTGGEPRDD